MKRSMQGWLFPIITFILWGSLYVISKYAMVSVPPITLLFMRYVLAAAVIFGFLKIRKAEFPRIRRQHLLLFIAIGFLGYGLAIALQQVGNDLLDASTAALINSINPVFIFLLAFMILKEKISLGKIIGILLSIAGVYIIFGSAGGHTSLAGIAISLGSVFFWSLSSVLVRSIVSKYDPVIITLYGMALSLIPLAPASLIELHFRTCTLTLPAILSILYLAVFATALAHVFWNKALNAAPVSTCSLFYPVQPLTSAVMGLLVLQESITQSFILGTIAISCGIVVSLLWKPHFSGEKLKCLTVDAERNIRKPANDNTGIINNQK